MQHFCVPLLKGIWAKQKIADMFGKSHVFVHLKKKKERRRQMYQVLPSSLWYRSVSSQAVEHVDVSGSQMRPVLQTRLCVKMSWSQLPPASKKSLSKLKRFLFIYFKENWDENANSRKGRVIVMNKVTLMQKSARLVFVGKTIFY